MVRMFNPPHPGGILSEELEYLGINANNFAKQIGIASDLMTEILSERAPITPEIAQKISEVLKVPHASTWLAMQADFNTWHAKKRQIS